MKKAGLVVLLFAALAAVACSRHKAAPQGRKLPVGDGVWFEDGLAENESEVEAELIRSGISWVFYPVCRVGSDGEAVPVTPVPPPAHPFAHLPVFLVVAGGEAGQGVWQRGAQSATALSNGIWLSVKDAIQKAARYGTIAGVHLDLPFNAGDMAVYGPVVANLRSKVPPTTLLSISLRFTPTAEQTEAMQTLLAGCDGLVAFMAGETPTADPVATDSLEKTWWAAFAPGSRGTWTSATGENRGPLPERILAHLIDDTRVRFLPDLALKDTSDTGFTLVPREAISVPEFSFRKGDHLVFRQPILADVVYHLGADVTGRRFVRGRVLVLPGRSESERIFTFGAFADLLAGKPAAVSLHVAVEGEKGAIRVEVQNVSPHASVISATANWVEIEVPSGGIREVQPGGFYRFEVYGPDRNPVTLGRATFVRFFEALVNPNEKIEPARILLRGQPPQDCCGYHFHVLSASGQEITSENAELTPTPGPTPGK